MRIIINTYIISFYNTLYKLLKLEYKSTISKNIILIIFIIIVRF
jgi:hypothetical protein